MNHYLLKNKDGSVQILTLIPQADGTYSTPEIEITKWKTLKPPRSDNEEVVSWREIDRDHIPTDRTFRDAWRDVTPEPGVDIDMPKARDIYRNRLREMRAPLLAALDIEYQRADEAGDAAKKKEIAARKQALRDVTNDPAIEKAMTADELKKVIPAVLTPDKPNAGHLP